jgi:murein DD-endopeptidase MepM/ murein hydrolase activator NlpD
MNHCHFARRARIIAFLVAISLILSATVAYAAYRINRPVAFGDEPILQTYLYGEGAAVHKGVDFSAGVDFGDSVYAVASGRVVEKVETRPNDCHPTYPPNDPRYCNAWGNYVLIRHNDRHYDRTTGSQLAYVYSLYLHLRWDQVLVEVDQDINAGDLIAQSDNTGNSDGHHVHLQIIVHPQNDRTLSNLESETRSRNPELWLIPYAGTGTVVGKTTNTSGNPVGNRLVCGLQKQAGWGYGSSLTYNNAALNPDDVLVENWGTTDVTPGTYDIFTCPYDPIILCNCSNPLSIGTHTVQAGRVTYVSLYPVWLPYVRGNYNGWNSTIYVRNNESTYTAQINTTFFNRDGTVASQRTDYIGPNVTLPMPVPAGLDGAAAVVSSESVAVEVVNVDQSPYTIGSYLGLVPTQSGSTLYLSLLYRDNSSWQSNFIVFNAGTASTQITVEYVAAPGGGSGCTATPVTLAPYGSYNFNQRTNPGCSLSATFIGGAHVTSSNGQPLTAVVRQKLDIGTDGIIESEMEYEALAMGRTPNALPLLMRNNSNWHTGAALQDTTGWGPRRRSITIARAGVPPPRSPVPTA